MSRLATALRAMKVYNDHGLLVRFAADRRRAVVVGYSSNANLCGWGCRGSSVSSPFFKTDPDAPWYDNECKTFVGNRAKSMPLALAWASKTYNIDEWAPSPFGDGAKVPREIRDAAERAVREAREKAEKETTP